MSGTLYAKLNLYVDSERPNEAQVKVDDSDKNN